MEANDLCAQLISRNDLDGADAACDHSLEYQSKYWDALHNKGVIAMMRGDKTTAKKRFVEAIRANPDMKVSHNDLGVLLMEDQDFTGAVEQFKAALHVDPKYLEARRNLGVSHLKLNACVEAEKDFRQLLLVEGRMPDGLLGLSAAFECQKKWDEAIEACGRLTRFNVDDVHAWHCVGRLKAEHGVKSEAREAFERCLLADPRNLECVTAMQQL